MRVRYFALGIWGLSWWTGVGGGDGPQLVGRNEGRRINASTTGSFAGEVGDLAVRRGVADGEEDVRPFGRGAVEDLGEERHRVGRVGQGRQPHRVEGRDEQAAGDPDALVDVVVASQGPVRHGGLALREGDHDPRNDVEEAFVGIGLQGTQGGMPLGH